jgi:hypothetical protein
VTVQGIAQQKVEDNVVVHRKQQMMDQEMKFIHKSTLQQYDGRENN